MQLWPDGESLLVSALAAERFARETMGARGRLPPAALRRMCAAAASAAATHLFDYEATTLSVDDDGTPAPLNQFNWTAAAATLGESAADAVDEALKATPMAPACCYRPEGWVREEGDGSGEEEQEGDDLYVGSRVLLALQKAGTAAAKGALVDEGAVAEAAGGQAAPELKEAAPELDEAERVVGGLEVQVTNPPPTARVEATPIALRGGAWAVVLPRAARSPG